MSQMPRNVLDRYMRVQGMTPERANWLWQNQPAEARRSDVYAAQINQPISGFRGPVTVSGQTPMTGAGSATGFPVGPGQSSSSSTNQSQSQSQQSTGIVPGMMNVYNQLLSKNEENYRNLLNAYTQSQKRLDVENPRISQGYKDLEAKVMNTLGMGQVLGQDGNWGIAGPAAREIAKLYAANRGLADQSMINAGLGNTTVRANLQTQNANQAAQAYGNLGAQLAQTAAGMQQQIGGNRLGAQLQGLGMGNQLGQSNLAALAGYRFANTAGDLTGSFGSSSGSSSGQSSSFSQAPQQQWQSEIGQQLLRQQLEQQNRLLGRSGGGQLASGNAPGGGGGGGIGRGIPHGRSAFSTTRPGSPVNAASLAMLNSMTMGGSSDNSWMDYLAGFGSAPAGAMGGGTSGGDYGDIDWTSGTIW